MSAATQAPAVLPMKKGIVKQVSRNLNNVGLFWLFQLVCQLNIYFTSKHVCSCSESEQGTVLEAISRTTSFAL